ncbi:MAG: FG-GAP repeat protein [Solirubrobacteraceae bacterium]|nr:FG-GAP repeat protein [Solirubrobacteraceae bacterium]
MSLSSRRWRHVLLVVLAAGIAPVGPTAAQAALPQLTGKILGPAKAASYFPGAATPLGDVNGDGLSDVLVEHSFDTVVLLGTRGTGLPASLTSGNRFAISYGSLSAQGRPGPAGDVDGDGFDDILVPSVDRAYVVHGGATTTSVDLTVPNPRVTVVEHGSVPGVIGASPAGDFDGDGFDDLSMRVGTGAAIIRGGPRVNSLSALDAGPRRILITGLRKCGFRLGLIWECATSLQAPVPVGDLNGDGKDDLLFPDRRFVSLGRAGTATINGAAPDGRSFATAGLIGGAVAARPGELRDFTGDGIDDFVAYPPITTGVSWVIPGRTGTSGTLDTAGASSIRIAPASSAEADAVWVTPAGDLDGDARADLVVTQAEQVAVLTGRPGPAAFTGLAALPKLTLPLGDLRDEPSARSPTAAGAGDLDGDGKDDLLVASSGSDDENLYNRGALFVLTHGADRVPPALYPRGSAVPEQGSNVVPAVFAPAPAGPGASIRIHLLEPATVNMRVRRAGGGGVLSTESLTGLPAGVTSLPWDGVSRGVGGAPGRYELVLVAVDSAGNRSAPQIIAFQISGSTTETPPKLRITRREVIPADTTVQPPAPGQSNYGGLTSRRVDGACPDSVTVYGLTETPSEVPVNDPRAGDPCALFYLPPSPADYDGFPPVPSDPAEYPWRTTISINGAAPVLVAPPKASDEPYVTIPAFALKNGVNTIDIVDTWDDAAFNVPAVDVTSTLAWSLPGPSGSVTNAASGDPASATGLELTPAAPNRLGVAVACPTAFGLGRFVVEFDAEISGGSGAGHGLTMAVFDRRPATVLASGANVGLGWVGYEGTAFALVTAKERYNPAQNFVGMAAGNPWKSGYPTWLAIATPSRSLAGATTRVRVQIAGGTSELSIDGTVLLRRAVTVPAGACLGFTAATGTRTQRHLIKNLRVSTI